MCETTTPKKSTPTTTDLYSELVAKFKSSFDEGIQTYKRDIEKFWNTQISSFIEVCENQFKLKDSSAIAFTVVIDDEENVLRFFKNGIEIFMSIDLGIEAINPEDADHTDNEKDSEENVIYIEYDEYFFTSKLEKNIVIDFVQKQVETLEQMGFQITVVSKGFCQVISFTLSLNDTDAEEDDDYLV